MSAPICSQEIPSGFYPGKCVEHLDTWKSCVDVGKMVYTDESDVRHDESYDITSTGPGLGRIITDIASNPSDYNYYGMHLILHPFILRANKRLNKITEALLPARISKPISDLILLGTFLSGCFPKAAFALGAVGMMDFAAEKATDRTAVDVPANLFG
jgi:hypothetical protein